MTPRAAFLQLCLGGLVACHRPADRTSKQTGEDAAPSVQASDFLPVTGEPRAELPGLPYRPAHTDDEYLETAGTMIGVKFYLEPLDEQMITARTAMLPADFSRVLGRTVSPGEVERWQRDMLEDMRRRRLVVRALLDLVIAGTLSLDALDPRMRAIHDGLDLAFQRITGITQAEHDKLSGR